MSFAKSDQCLSFRFSWCEHKESTYFVGFSCVNGMGSGKGGEEYSVCSSCVRQRCTICYLIRPNPLQSSETGLPFRWLWSLLLLFLCLFLCFCLLFRRGG